MLDRISPRLEETDSLLIKLHWCDRADILRADRELRPARYATPIEEWCATDQQKLWLSPNLGTVFSFMRDGGLDSSACRVVHKSGAGGIGFCADVHESCDFLDGQARAPAVAGPRLDTLPVAIGYRVEAREP